MCIKTFGKIKINWTIMNIMKTLNILKKQRRKSLKIFFDQACGIPVVEFIGLRSKMYSYIKIMIKTVRQLKEKRKML